MHGLAVSTAEVVASVQVGCSSPTLTVNGEVMIFRDANDVAAQVHNTTHLQVGNMVILLKWMRLGKMLSQTHLYQ